MPELSTPTTPANIPPAWGRRWLQAAGIYNLLWGALVIAAPNLAFRLAGMDLPRYPQIWQCVGMIVGVYGIGYLIAARDHRTHWPIVLVGLLGKILGPIGVVVSIARGDFTLAFGLISLTNDLLWWPAFFAILWDAARSHAALPGGPTPTLDQAFDTLTDQHGRTIRQVSTDRPTLVVLTRHTGCTFCRETLAELAANQARIKDLGWNLAVVTMSPQDINLPLAARYTLDWASWFSDPARLAYRALELRRGNFWQLFGPAVILRGALATLRGNLVGPLVGDGFQMAGTFVLHRGRVIRAFRHRSAADRPELSSMVCELPS